MPFDPQRHHRRSIRLKGYDYAQAGAYFVTICAQGRECFFGEVVNDQVQLNDAGQMMESAWLDLPNRFPHVELDEFVVMPNHMHGIIVIVDRATDDVGAGLVPAPKAITNGATPDRATPDGATPDGATTRVAPTAIGPTLGDIVGAYKSITTDEYIVGVKQRGWPRFDRKLLQRNYYEHIIRNERELNAIRQYIQNNPLKWALDRDNPTNWKGQGGRGVQLNALTGAPTNASTTDTVEMYLREAGL